MSLKLNERYPARFNNPTAGYPQGSFKNRTTPTSKDGSYLEKDWANDKEGFFQSLLSAAGVTANGAVDAVGASQFFDALQSLKQIQSGAAFTTGGTSPALTLSPSPPITGYSANQRFRVKFSSSSTGADTLNISSLGSKSIKQYNSTGNKVAAVFSSGQLTDVEYDGTDMVVIDQLPIPPFAYTPVQQGGGIGQSTNKIYIGYSAGLTRPAMTVDSTDFGGIVFLSDISALPFTRAYVSAQQTVSNGGLVSLPHGLGAVPKLVTGELVCVTAENGWSIGDVQIISMTPDNDDSAVLTGFIARKDATSIYARCGTSGPYGANINTGTNAVPTAANWKLVVRAFA